MDADLERFRMSGSQPDSPHIAAVVVPAALEMTTVRLSTEVVWKEEIWTLTVVFHGWQ
jgi:hypothetical protein